MKLALVTDLHANREAVEAVLEHSLQQGAHGHAFLGDFVGYGADPGWVVDTVQALVAQGAIAVLGNHDAGVINGPSPSMTPIAREVVAWTRAQLSAAQLDFLARLPLQHSDGQMLFVHANAVAPSGWAYVHSRREAVRSLKATDCRYTFCGHMHLPMLYHLSGSGRPGAFKPVPEVAIPVPPHRRWLAVPGSAGQPRDGNPAACYAMLDTVRHLLTFHRVPYDHAAAASKVLAAGLPAALAERLGHGR